MAYEPAYLPHPSLASSLEVVARTALILFGHRPTAHEAHGDLDSALSRLLSRSHNDDELSNARFRRAAADLELSRRQRNAIGDAVALVQPLVSELRSELREKERRLIALRPDAGDFAAESARLGSQVGMLVAQIALISSKLKTDVYSLLTPAQCELLSELRFAFEPPEAAS